MRVKEFWFEHQLDGTVDLILQLEQGTGYRLKNVKPLNWEPGPIPEGDADEVILEAVNLKYQPLLAPSSLVFSSEMDKSFNDWAMSVQQKMGDLSMPAPMVAKFEQRFTIERAVMAGCEWDGEANMLEGEATIKFMELGTGKEIEMTASRQQYIEYQELIQRQFYPSVPDELLPQSNRPKQPPPTLFVKYRTRDDGKHVLVEMEERKWVPLQTKQEK